MREITKKVIYKQLPTPNSITCGPENPASLGCQYYVLEDKEVATVFVPKQVHEGQLGIVHGGLSAAVLDELMGRAVLAFHEEEIEEDMDHDIDYDMDRVISRYVTAEMTTRYKKPILIGHKIYGYGRVISHEGRRTFASAELMDEGGERVATAEAVFVEIKVSRDKLTDKIVKGENRQNLSKKDPKAL